MGLLTLSKRKMLKPVFLILPLTILVIITSTTGAIWEHRTPFTFESIIEIPSDSVSEILESVRSHVYTFSGFGSRFTGYPGMYRAADYIYNKFIEYGLVNVSFHYYNITVPIDYGATLSIISPNIDRSISLYPLLPNIVAPVQTPPGGIYGDLVYVKDGSSFNGIPVNGSIVLMDFNSQYNWLRAAKFGAKAVIFIEPEDTSWYEGRAKVIDVAFSFPRLYVKEQDAIFLLNLIEKGTVKARLESNMRFETIKACNVMGYVKGTLFPDLYIIVSAYYDSFSYVPSVAPGADSAIGISVLLETARFFAKNPPKFSILFIAFSGRNQGLIGSRSFVWEKVVNEWDTFGRRIVAQIHIDLSAERSDVGISNSGMFYHRHAGLGKNKETFIQHYVPGLVREIESRIGPHFKVDLNAFSSELIGVTAGATWFFTVGALPTAFDSESLVLIDGPGLAIYTPAVFHKLWGTPIDEPGRISFGNLRDPIKFTLMFLNAILNEENLRSLLPEWTPGFCTPSGPKWVNVLGTVAEYDDEKGWYNPVPDALVVYRNYVWVGPSFYQIARLWSYTTTDAEGKFYIYGFTESNMIGSWYISAYKVDSETGNIIYAPDMGDRGYGNIYYGIYKHPFDVGYITVFKSGHIVIFDIGDPYFHNQALDGSVRVAFADIRSHYPTLHRGMEFMIFSGGGTSVAVFHVPIDTPIEVVMLASYAIRRPLGMLTNSSEKEPYGSGYVVSEIGQQYIITNTRLHFAENIYWLNEARLRELSAQGIYLETFQNIHKQIRSKIQAAKDLLKTHQYEASDLLASDAWKCGRDLYVMIKDRIEDSVNVVPFFGLLLLPFAFIVEKLLISASGKKRLISLILCYLLPSSALWLLHPGFKLAQNSMMVLSGFTIIILSVPILGIIGGFFIDAIKALRKRVMGLHFAEISRSSIMAFTFSYGVEQMKKRPLRTSLILVSIILVTVSVTLFTSLSPLSVLRWTETGLPAPYDGILIRPNQWGRIMPNLYSVSGNNLGDDVYRLLLTKYESNATLAPRSWLYMYNALMSMKTTRGNNTIYIFAVLGLAPQESEVSGIDSLLVNGRWFIDTDFNAVILTSNQAKLLNVSSLPSSINFMGINMTVVGIIDSSAVDSFKDIDREGITPLEFRAPVTTYDVHMAVDDVLIVPFKFSKSIGAFTVSVAIKLNDPSKYLDVALDLFNRFQLPISVGVSGRQYLVSKGIFITIFGFQFQILPLVISALLTANIFLGAVEERKREIATLAAVGLSPFHVAVLFLAEAVTAALLGGLLGYLIGLLAGTGLAADVFLNISSTWAVSCVSVIMVTVIASSSYPLWLSSKLVTPSLIRAWRPPKPHGDLWEIPLPFSADLESEVNGIMAYFYEFFSLHNSDESPVFWTKEIRFLEEERDGEVRKTINMVTSLAPHESDVKQSVSFLAFKPRGVSRYQFHLTINRLSGNIDYWEARNASYIGLIRKQFLLWRSLKPEEREGYIRRFKDLKK